MNNFIPIKSITQKKQTYTLNNSTYQNRIKKKKMWNGIPPSVKEFEFEIRNFPTKRKYKKKKKIEEGKKGKQEAQNKSSRNFKYIKKNNI